MEENLYRITYRYFFVVAIIILFLGLSPLTQISGLVAIANNSGNRNLDNNPSINSFLETNDYSPNKYNYTLLSHLNAGKGSPQTDLCINNDLLYVAYNDLFIYDMSNLSSPILLTKYTSKWGSIIDLKIENNIAYLICQKLGVVILNVTDYSSITELGKCGFFDGDTHQPKLWHAVVSYGCISGNVAYIVASGERTGVIEWDKANILYLIDLSDPQNPKPFNYFEEGRYLRQIFIIGDRCYIDVKEDIRSNDIHILDISDPENIKKIAKHSNVKLVSIYDDSKVIIEKNYGHWLADFTNPGNPVYICQLAVSEKNAITNNCAYSFDTLSGNLSIINIQNGDNPIYYSQITTNNKVNSLHVSENLLYIIGSKIQIFNITNFQTPVLVTEFPYSEEATHYFDFFIENDRMYVLDANVKIIIQNYTTLNNPKTIGQFFFDYDYTLSYSNRIDDVSFFVKNNCCYVIRDNYFEIINCTVPSLPVRIYSEKLIESGSTFFSSSMYIINSILYLTSRKTLYIYNISIPHNPVVLSELELDPDPYLTQYYHMNYKNNCLFISSNTCTKIINVSSLLNPVVLTTLDDESYNPADTLIHNNFFFKSFTDIEIYDVTDLTNPIFISTIAENSYTESFYAKNDYLFASNFHGVTVYNISNILNVEKVGSFGFENFDFPDPIYYDIGARSALHVINDTIFSSINALGLTIIGKDSDHDYLADYLEETIYYTNPFVIDSDYDNMLDGYEAVYGLNPLNNSDRNIDFDFDGLTNFAESVLITDPFSNDTDSDMICDNDEELYGTNATIWDTDRDGLSDGLEIFIVNLDPTLSDTDNDELSDFHELVDYKYPRSFLFYWFVVPAIVIVTIVVLTVFGVIVSGIIKRKKRKS